MKIFLIILVVVVLLFIYITRIYNAYVGLDTENQNAFSNISVFLQKRLDLIPNIVETVKGYAKHEKETLENVINARSKMSSININDINDVEKISKYENELSHTLKSIMMLSENYPELKADRNFLNLQEKLQEIETEIERSRRYYNATTTDLNKFTRIFPNVLFSGIFRFRQAKLFEAEENANKGVKVEF